MKPCGLEKNADGSWTAWIYSTRFTGTESECRAWLRANGESY